MLPGNLVQVIPRRAPVKRDKSRSINKLVIYILILIITTNNGFIRCQSDIEDNDGDERGNVTTTTPDASSTEVGLRLAGLEFVDHNESPIPLFDSISSSNDSKLIVDGTETSILDETSTTQRSNIVDDVTTTPTTITITADEDTKRKENPNERLATRDPTIETNHLTTVTSKPTNEDNKTDETSTSLEDDTNDETDESSEDSENNQGENKFQIPQNVSQYMDYIERLMRDLRHQVHEVFEPHIPRLIRTSQTVELSEACSHDILRMALALRQFEPWALKMIDSSGKLPEGIFEGSFTALGSYDQCLNIQFATPSSSSSSSLTSPSSQQTTSSETIHSSSSSTSSLYPAINNVQAPTKGKYCLVSLSPYLPPKPTPASMVDQLFQEEANRRNYTKDDQLSRLSPIFYYMKFRIGICVPSTCADSDMESITSTFGESFKLNITVSACRVKQSQPVTSHQLVGGSIVGLIVTLVIMATLYDYSKHSWDKLIRREKEIVLISVNSLTNGNDRKNSGVAVSIDHHPSKRMCPTPVKSSTFISDDQEEYDRKSNHWYLRSFSILFNFGLYFNPRILKRDTKHSSSKHIFRECQNNEPKSNSDKTVMISCLNGIRVISLCWVIIANSYITLDPRATKRLVKTREAPRDFLFQIIAQASLAIETFFFLSGVLMSVSFYRKLKPLLGSNSSSDSSDTKLVSFRTRCLGWLRFYLHRYIRLTPSTMLVIAFTMFAFRFGDGPLWMEVTHKSHLSCSKNWWRHLMHIANYIDTRQMCFIHYWYIAADMQLFLFAPFLMLLYYRKKLLGYFVTFIIAIASISWVFYTTYIRNLPPTLLFYSSDPETRREFGNVVMTKPLTHALPYIVGMLLGKWLTNEQQLSNSGQATSKLTKPILKIWALMAVAITATEIFIPYVWNNSKLPSPFLSSLYASVFRFAWSLSLAYLVVSCRHKRGKNCVDQSIDGANIDNKKCSDCIVCCCCSRNNNNKKRDSWREKECQGSSPAILSTSKDKESKIEINERFNLDFNNRSSVYWDRNEERGSKLSARWCFCGSGGSSMNRFLSLRIFTHLSKLSFVAYLIHLPLMSLFIAQTRGLFAFSHLLVIHLALSYLLMTFILSFILVHIIEFPFITLERYFFQNISRASEKESNEARYKHEAHYNQL